MKTCERPCSRSPDVWAVVGQVAHRDTSPPEQQQQQQPSVWQCHFSSPRVCLSYIVFAPVFQIALVFSPSRFRPHPCFVSPALPFVCCQVITCEPRVSSTSQNIVSDTYNNKLLICFSKSEGVHVKVRHNFLAFIWLLFLLLFFFLWLPPRERAFPLVHFSLL